MNLLLRKVHKAIRGSIVINLFQIVGDDLNGWKLLPLRKEPFQDIHIPFGRIAAFTNHEDIVHVIGPSLTSGNNMVNGQFLRVLHIPATVPADIRILYLGNIVFQEVMNLPASLLICLECLRPNCKKQDLSNLRFPAARAYSIICKPSEGILRSS